MYTLEPSLDGEIIVHIHRSWTGIPLVAVTVKVAATVGGERRGYDGDDEDGAKFTKIVYEGAQGRWETKQHEEIPQFFISLRPEGTSE